jgi:hypothetical protein
MDSMTTIINFWGGPGSGKSIAAAQAYIDLSKLGYGVELIREYIKDWVWEDRKRFTLDQTYIMGKQMRREQVCLGQVDYIATDSPVWLSAFYDEYYCDHGDVIKNVVKEYYRQLLDNGHDIVHFFMNRSGTYNPKGRYETEEDAIKIDRALGQFCWDNNIIVSSIVRDEPIIGRLRDCGFTIDGDTKLLSACQGVEPVRGNY